MESAESSSGCESEGSRRSFEDATGHSAPADLLRFDCARDVCTRRELSRCSSLRCHQGELAKDLLDHAVQREGRGHCYVALEDYDRSQRWRHFVCRCRRQKTLSGLRPQLDSGRSQRRENLSRGIVLELVGFDGGILRSGPASGRRLELSRRVGGALAGQYKHFGADVSIQQWLWHFLEQHLTQPLQQSLSTRALSQLRSSRRRRLLLSLRARVRFHRRGLSRHDRPHRRLHRSADRTPHPAWA